MAQTVRRGLIELAIWLLIGAVLLLGLRMSYTCFYRHAYPVEYEELILEHAGRQDLPPELVFAVVRTESGFRPDAQSSVGARGLMQITSDTFEWAQYRSQEQQALPFDKLYSPEVNIKYGTYILRLLIDQFGSVENALAAYHAGWGNVSHWLSQEEYSPDGENLAHIPFDDTRSYVNKVLKTAEIYQTLYGF